MNINTLLYFFKNSLHCKGKFKKIFLVIVQLLISVFKDTAQE